MAKNEDDLKNEDSLKNEGDLKNEDDLKNEVQLCFEDCARPELTQPQLCLFPNCFL